LCVLLYLLADVLFLVYDHTGGVAAVLWAREFIATVPGCLVVTFIGALLFDVVKKYDFPDEDEA